MPSWLKKRFRLLKNDLINHLVVEKTKKQLMLATTPNRTICDNSHNNHNINNINNNNNNDEGITNDSNKKVRIRRIRNNLHSNRFTNKTDMNAYNDYTKWRDQVLINQNNCALRCINREEEEVEEKIINTDKIDSHCPNGFAIRNNTNSDDNNNSRLTFENRQMRCNNRNNHNKKNVVRTTTAAASSSDDTDVSDAEGINDANCDSESEFMAKSNAAIHVFLRI